MTLGTRRLIELADTFTTIQNRLRTVTRGTEELNRVTEALFEVSNRTRNSFRGTIEIFARTSLAAKQLGVSQQQLVQFTESVNQAVLLSGASAREARAALIQLSQGLASNALRGDELRSILEQLPVVADVIAKSMKVTRGELREMGSQGLISAAIVLKAFKEARVELADRFTRVLRTVGQSLTVLHNQFIRLVGVYDQARGLSRGLSDAILVVAGNLDLIARGAIVAGAALAVPFARIGVGAAIVAVRALTLAMLRNPIGALAVGITVVGVALVTFASKSVRAAKALDNLKKAYRNFLRSTAFIVDRTVGLFVGLGFAIEVVFDDVTNAINRAINNLIPLINLPIRALNELREELGQEPIELFEELPERALANGISTAEAFAEGFRSVTFASDAVERLFRDVPPVVDKATDAVRNFDKATRETESALLKGLRLGLGAVEKEFTDLSKLMSKTVVRSFKSAEDAMIEMFTTGKLGMRDFIDSLLADMARLALRQNITGPLATLFSGLVAPTPAPVPGDIYGALAHGGLVRGPGGPRDDVIPTMLSNGEFVVNAAATRAFLPLLNRINRNGRGEALVQPASASPAVSRAPSPVRTGGGGGVSVTVVDQRTSRDSEPVDVSESTGPDGRRQIVILVRDTVERQIGRGEFDRSMLQRFSVKPTTIQRG